MTHPALTDTTHVYIGGVTGSGDAYGGKTATANWWASTLVDKGHFDFAVAFDPKGGQFDGADVRSAEEAAAAVQEGVKKLDWTVDGDPTNVGKITEHHGAAVSFASGLNGSVVFVHDDAVMFGDGDALKWATALAGNPGPGDDAIKSLVVSQDPWDLPRKGVRTNLPIFVWVGPVTDNAERFFESFNRHDQIADVRAAHDENGAYTWSIIDGDDVTTMDGVPEVYAR